MFIDIIPNRGSPPPVRLRESYRDEGRVRKRRLANLSTLAPAQIEAMRAILRGKRLVPAGEGLEIVRSLPHGHVLAALGTARRIGLEQYPPSRNRLMTVRVVKLLEKINMEQFHPW